MNNCLPEHGTCEYAYTLEEPKAEVLPYLRLMYVFQIMDLCSLSIGQQTRKVNEASLHWWRLLRTF